MTYEELMAALTEFDLPAQVTLKKIRERHRQLVRRYHPDKGVQTDIDKIKRINAAYKILNEYIKHYRFDFSEETFFRNIRKSDCGGSFMTWGCGAKRDRKLSRILPEIKN